MVCRYHQRVAVYIGDPESIHRGLDVIRILRLLQQGQPAIQRTLMLDTPWITTRWANPRYL